MVFDPAMGELSWIITETSMNRSKLFDMVSSAMHLSCVKGAVSTTWRVKGLIWDMLEDVGAETLLRSSSLLRTFLFSNHMSCEQTAARQSCEQQSSTVMPLTDESEASDLNREIILRIFRAFSADDFFSIFPFVSADMFCYIQDGHSDAGTEWAGVLPISLHRMYTRRFHSFTFAFLH
jgi:hypothetical protein